MTKLAWRKNVKAASIIQCGIADQKFQDTPIDELTELAQEKYNNQIAEVDDHLCIWTGNSWLDHDGVHEFVSWVLDQRGC